MAWSGRYRDHRATMTTAAASSFASITLLTPSAANATKVTFYRRTNGPVYWLTKSVRKVFHLSASGITAIPLVSIARLMPTIIMALPSPGVLSQTRRRA
eukprot:g38969.t1